MERISRNLTRLAFVAWLLLAHPAQAGNLCPPPPNPLAGNCPLQINRATLTETDVDQDGQPDNEGSPGSFCGGGSPAECGGVIAAEIGFDLIVLDPQRQDVTCTVPGADVWIMSDGCNSCLAVGFESATLPAGTTTDATLRVVVADVNGDVCPCGPTLTCTVNLEADCADGADGDGDGLIDAADPDCCLDNDGDGFCGASDCDDSDPTVNSSPRDIRSLEVSIDQGQTTLSWPDQTGRVADVVTGFVADLAASGDFSLAMCLADDEQANSLSDGRADPPTDEAYYYLARSQNACGSSGYGESSPESGLREDLDVAGPCPYDPSCPTCEIFGCDLLDPAPVCGNRHCFPLEDQSDTSCVGQVGSGTATRPCQDLFDCAAGHLCLSLSGASECREWCRTNSDCGLFFSTCETFSPRVIIDGTVYGFCN